MNQRIIFGTACVVLAALCIALGSALYKQPRFVTTKGENPYLMFDRKTAQVCWSGPEEHNPYAEFESPLDKQYEIVREAKPYNHLGLPFCKDLK